MQPNEVFSQLILSTITAGFPSPAQDDYDEEMPLDLNRHIVKHPTATFFIRVSGDSMVEAGIHPNDLLVVDRSLTPTPKNIVVATINREFTVKYFERTGDAICLLPANNSYQPIPINPEDEFEVWGVVTYVIHATQKH